MRTIQTKAQKPQLNSEFLPSSSVFRYIKPLKCFGYSVTQQLGHGSEGVVFLAQNERSGKQVAIKACDRKKCPKNAIGEFWLWAYVDHPNCLKIQEKFTIKKIVYYVMEYTPNLTVLDWIQDAWYSNIKMDEENHPNEEMIKNWCRQLLSGVQYLHDKGFYHLDIKPDNVFLDEDWNVKLGDFGFMRTISDMSEPLILGCPAYMPPEGLVSTVALGIDLAKVDVWSTGVTIFEMLTGKLLSGKNFKICGQKRSLLLQNLRENYPKACKMDTFYPGGHDLVLHMTMWEASSRVSATDALQHPWLRMISGNGVIHTPNNRCREDSPGMFKSLMSVATDRIGRTAIAALLKTPANKLAHFYTLFRPTAKLTKSTTSISKSASIKTRHKKEILDHKLEKNTTFVRKRKLKLPVEVHKPKRFKADDYEEKTAARLNLNE